MKIFELLQPPTEYYLGTDLLLKGEVTRGDLGPPDLTDHKGASALETFRPAACLSRTQSILLAAGTKALGVLGFRAGRIYRVVALGPVQWSDQQWWDMIREATRLPVGDQPSVEEWAAQYWAGAPAPTGEPRWEGRCAAVKIIGLIP
jgi:hypothetical protein